VEPGTPGIEEKAKKLTKKTKAVRRLQFDEDKSSPVSGTIIRHIDSVRDELLNCKDEQLVTSLGIQVSFFLISFVHFSVRSNKSIWTQHLYFLFIFSAQ